MANRKFLIYDDNGKEAGFLVIETETPPTFQHVAIAGPVGDALADVALLVTSLTGFTVVGWFLPGPEWIGPAVGLTTTAVLAGIKAWRGGLLPAPGEQSDSFTIRLEAWQDNRVLLSEIRDESIRLEDWRKLADAIIKHRANFSRSALGRYISQTTYHKVVQEFTYQGDGWIDRQGNNYFLGPRAIDFLLKIRTLPY